MNINKLKLPILASFTLALIALIMPSAANAQGRYTGKYSKRDVSSIINKLERSSNDFAREFDRQLDQSSLNGTNEEDRLNDIVRDYEDALDDLRREFDRNDSWWESRNEVQSVMREARDVNQMMNNLVFARKLESRWKTMRKDLNKLADTYDLPALDGSNDNNNNGGGNVPSWAIGTFSGRNPQSGGTIILTISNDGNVTINIDGNFSYATMRGDRLINAGAEAKVTRLQNGIRTTNVNNGSYIDYYRSSNDGGNTGGGNVPSWAVGTFSGRNPQSGGTIILTIGKEGNVTINIDGNFSYATMRGDRLINAGSEAKVTRTRNGIRTTNVTDGSYIDYYRSSNDNNNNNGGGNVPSWAIGTFSGRNPQSGGTIILTISNDGNVTINIDGNFSYATMRGDRLINAGAEAKVTRTRNGIRTTNVTDGSYIDYVRVN